MFRDTLRSIGHTKTQTQLLTSLRKRILRMTLLCVARGSARQARFNNTLFNNSFVFFGGYTIGNERIVTLLTASNCSTNKKSVNGR